jgi:hypothetical protein
VEKAAVCGHNARGILFLSALCARFPAGRTRRRRMLSFILLFVGLGAICSGLDSRKDRENG